MISFEPTKKLPKKFYNRYVIQVAHDLLGKIFIRILNGKILSGKIVEVEAYDGNIDEASHSYIGKTKRNEIMFESGGLLYVYFTYGVHFCANIVTGTQYEGQAVLLRGIEPIDGFEIMALNRYGRNEITDKEKINLANGPGKICRAFGLAREANGTDLLGEEIFLLDAKKIPSQNIVTTNRIGIRKSIDLPWRFYIKNNPYVSRK
ncbi:MAG: DNA-3-methyladenine glycosylase [bacterium]